MIFVWLRHAVTEGTHFAVGFPFFREHPSAGWRYPSAEPPPEVHNYKSPVTTYRPWEKNNGGVPHGKAQLARCQVLFQHYHVAS